MRYPMHACYKAIIIFAAILVSTLYYAMWLMWAKATKKFPRLMIADTIGRETQAVKRLGFLFPAGMFPSPNSIYFVFYDLTKIIKK